jgi:hypothetical protein
MIRPLAVALACAALIGCDSSTAPSASAGVFVLKPPAVLENEVVRIEILNEKLSLYADGTAQREYRERLDFVGTVGRDTTLDVQEEYTYALGVDGSTITFAALCDDIGICAPPPHLWGRITDASLELHSSFDPDAVLRYNRVFPPD